MTKPNILVFYGSSRGEEAAAPKVATWLKTELDKVTTATFSYIDLAQLNLPFYGAPDPADSVAKWQKAVDSADGYIVITNEYNHAPSAIIKNAIDSAKPEWAHKAVGYISYGGVAGGSRAVEHLRQIFTELRVASTRDQIYFPHVYSGLNPQGKLEDLLADLLWWTEATMAARISK